MPPVAPLAALAPPLATARADASWSLAVRMLLSPALIGGATLVARRWGPEAGGWVAALPLTSGPVVLVLALERGPAFAAQACVGILLATVSLAAYVLAYARASRRLGWPASATLACLAYTASLWPLGHLRSSLSIAFLCACAAVIGTRPLLPRDADPHPPAHLPAWDPPLRIALAAGLVWGIARLAGEAGPRASGLLAPFPVAVTIMSAFAHRHEGAAAARRFLRSLLTGLVSFGVFFLAAGSLLPAWGTTPALLAATAGALATHAAGWSLARRRHVPVRRIVESDPLRTSR